jgi:aldose 1-epimerase
MQKSPEVQQFSLNNSHGMRVVVTNFGATIMSIEVPDRDGVAREVTLGFDSLEDYVRIRTHMGAMAGRVANRIAKGTFTLEGRQYQLACNNGQNHLHGGINGWAKVPWEVSTVTERQVIFKLHSPDGDEGYPGNVDVLVTYALSDDNALSISIQGTTDAPTLINPTSHCYFNFNKSHEELILNHILQINAEYFTPSDAGLIPTGEIVPVKDSPLDFRTAKRIGQDIDADDAQLRNALGYDHNWVLDNFDGSVRRCATLYCPPTGIVMETWSDQPGIQCYTGNLLGKYIGRNGLQYPQYSGICLETQGFPDAVNHANFPSVVVKPGQRYEHLTRYQFLYL